MIKVRAYETEDGVRSYENWFFALSSDAARRVEQAIRRMELGNLADHKSLGEGVYERRIDFGPGYRVYFGKQGGQLIILLGGGTKKRQQADIARAKHLWKQYKKRKRTGD